MSDLNDVNDDSADLAERSPLADSVRVELRGQTDPADDGEWLLHGEPAVAVHEPEVQP